MKKDEGVRVAALGGGTGLSTMLRGIKSHTSEITAIVTVADDGGGSGVLRQDLGMLPPGDIRNCILALAETEPLMAKLLQYRFKEGRLCGQSFGNLFLAAMCGISESFEEAVRRMSDVLRVTGRVLPVTTDDVNIEAVLEDGEIVRGESNIGHVLSDGKSRIETIRLVPAAAVALPDTLDAIADADIILLGPGSLYTSIIPNLLVPGVSDAIINSAALKVYVCNLMTQPGETNSMTAYEHAEAICRHAGGQIIDYCITNNEEIPKDILARYAADGAEPLTVSRARFMADGITLIERELLRIKGEKIRHDYNALAKVIFEAYAEHIGRGSQKMQDENEQTAG